MVVTREAGVRPGVVENQRCDRCLQSRGCRAENLQQKLQCTDVGGMQKLVDFGRLMQAGMPPFTLILNGRGATREYQEEMTLCTTSDYDFYC